MLRYKSLHALQVMRGFTLIELLVVLAILGVLGSLVGPVGFAQYQRAIAIGERQELRSIIQQTQMEAFRQRSAIDIQLAEDYLEVLRGDTVESYHQFEHIRFEPQHLRVNSHAIWSYDVLYWTESGVDRELNLNKPKLMDDVSQSATLEFAR